MDALNFATWLQGFAELSDKPPTPEQWQSIKEHLQTVFVKVTPEVKKAEPVRLKDAEYLRKMFEDAKVEREKKKAPFDHGPYYIEPRWLDSTGVPRIPPGHAIC